MSYDDLPVTVAVLTVCTFQMSAKKKKTCFYGKLFNHQSHFSSSLYRLMFIHNV